MPVFRRNQGENGVALAVAPDDADARSLQQVPDANLAVFVSSRDSITIGRNSRAPITLVELSRLSFEASLVSLNSVGEIRMLPSMIVEITFV